MPTFSYSIGSKFNKINTPSVCGIFSNYLMSEKGNGQETQFFQFMQLANTPSI